MAARGEFVDESEGAADAEPASPTEEEAQLARVLALAGLRPVDADGNDCSVKPPSADAPPWYLWPCNVKTWNLWARVQTQWRAGMAGATGLDYAGVWSLLDRVVRRPREALRHFDRIQDMERAALKVWDEKRANAATK
jgi:hypothetical protein